MGNNNKDGVINVPQLSTCPWRQCVKGICRSGDKGAGRHCDRPPPSMAATPSVERELLPCSVVRVPGRYGLLRTAAAVPGPDSPRLSGLSEPLRRLLASTNAGRYNCWLAITYFRFFPKR